MAISVVMPALELTQETGKLVSWRKKEGEAVAKGETLLEVETDKAVVEVEAQADGFLAGVNAKDGEVIAVGTTIAWIVAKGEAPPQNESTAVSPKSAATKIAPAEKAKPDSSQAVSGAKPKVSPKARRIAAELNVNLDNVHGSGPGGEILASDIEVAAKTPAPARQAASADADNVKLETFTAIGRLMAERTTQSWTSVPHFFLQRDVDVGALLSAREKIVLAPDKSPGVKITHTDLLVAIVSRVLIRHPRLNATYAPDGIRFHPRVNMGIAIAVNDGVIAAVIPNAQTARVAEIVAQRHDLVDRAKAGKSRTQDLMGATFTISNLGMFKIDAFTAIIPPSQAGILAVGAIADRVVAIDGKPAVRTMMTITLSCDHRVVDGAHGARFVDDLAGAIANVQDHLGEL
jgi:pyruvate dehydrogenase E2 component (dihydrolipoamide acetyltransferase)